MKGHHIIAAACASLLAACAQPPISPSAGPGATPTNPAVAGTLFAQVCIANLPRFTGAPATLATLPFTQRSGTGTYYHNDLNLSFNTSNGDCSLVFFTTDSTPAPEFVAASDQAGIPGSGDATFRIFAGAGGLTGANVRLAEN